MAPSPQDHRLRKTSPKPASPLAASSLLALQAPPPEWLPPDPETPRGRILAAARRMFAEQGLEATSIRDITNAAGVNSAMVHYYYKSKDELYRRVLGLELLAVFRNVHAQIDGKTAPGELLMSLPTRIMRIVRENPIWAKLLGREISSGGPHLQIVVGELKDAGPMGIRKQAELIYKEALRRGEVRDLPITNVVQFLITIGYSGLFFNPFFRVIGNHDPDEPRHFNERIRVFEDLIRHALMPVKKSV